MVAGIICISLPRILSFSLYENISHYECFIETGRREGAVSHPTGARRNTDEGWHITAAQINKKKSKAAHLFPDDVEID